MLRRRETTTDVLLVDAEDGRSRLPYASPREDTTQWHLAEALLRESGIGEVDRLYGSSVQVLSDEGVVGVFVAFTRSEADPPGSRWSDLRAACRDASTPWSQALTAVRDGFVGRPPDEALRLR